MLNCYAFKDYDNLNLQDANIWKNVTVSTMPFVHSLNKYV